MVGDANGWGSNADIRPLAPLPGAPKGRKQSKAGAEDGSQEGSKEKKTRNRKPSSCKSLFPGSGPARPLGEISDARTGA